MLKIVVLLSWMEAKKAQKHLNQGFDNYAKYSNISLMKGCSL